MNGTEITRSSDMQSAYKLVAAHTVVSDWQFDNVSSNRTAQPYCLNFSTCITVSCPYRAQNKWRDAADGWDRKKNNGQR